MTWTGKDDLSSIRGYDGDIVLSKNLAQMFASTLEDN